jgi:hypothetical protein
MTIALSGYNGGNPITITTVSTGFFLGDIASFAGPNMKMLAFGDIDNPPNSNFEYLLSVSGAYAGLTLNNIATSGYSFNFTPPGSPASFDTDGYGSFYFTHIYSSNFSATGGAVPEPASTAALAAAVAGLCLILRRKQRIS